LNGQDSCKIVATAVGESWKFVLLSVSVEVICFANVLSVACCVIRLNVSSNLSRRYPEDCGTSWVVDFNVQLDIVMDTSVYLVSYDGLLVETTTHKNCLCLFISVFIVQKIKIKKKNK